MQNTDTSTDQTTKGLIALVIAASLAGLAAGIVCTLFRLTLEHIADLRNSYILKTGDSAIAFIALISLTALAAGVAAFIVRKIPSAAGSGIPRVMAVLDGKTPPAPMRVVPAKFVAGTLAIGAGLALGQEGPSVQMGASISYQTGRLLRINRADCMILLAAGSAAGLSAIFNAPIAGAAFLFEVISKRFETRTAIATMVASATAVWVARYAFGETPDFAFHHLTTPSLLEMPLFVILGMIAGLAAILYNSAVLTGLNTIGRIKKVPVELRAASIGAAAGTIAWFAPALAGGGDALAKQALTGVGTPGLLVLFLIVRLVMISFSASSGTPGGLLVPFLVLGADLGLLFGKICAFILPTAIIEPQGFAFVGMAALFTAILRAPLTAIILVVEMTTDITMLFPMLVACAAAIFVPALFGERAIMETLKERFLRGAGSENHS